MLKRFMTWLLRRLQGLMGALNGKRSNSPSPSQDLRDRSSQMSERPSEQASDRRVDAAVPSENRPQSIDTSRATVSIVEHLPNQPPAKPDNRPANDLPDGTMPEPDTHRRLDAAAAAPTNIETVTPSFPTNVSELLSSPTQTDEQAFAKETSLSSEVEKAITPETSIRSLKKVTEDKQLPSIHDVLPAVASEVVDEPVEIEAKTELGTVESLPPKPAETEPIETKSLEPEPVSTAEQAVLFSFDIVERAVDARGDEPLAEELLLEQEPLAEESDDVTSISVDVGSEGRCDELDSSVTENSSIDNSLVDILPIDEAPPANDDVSLADKASSLVEASPAELLDSKVETLPYPWSLPATDTEETVKETQPERDVQIAKAAGISPETVETAESEPAIVQHPPDTRPIKNGIVKLLFTLKEGNFHGYIAPDDGSKDILFHQKYINADIFAHLERGVPVTASVKYIEGKVYATRVDLL